METRAGLARREVRSLMMPKTCHFQSYSKSSQCARPLQRGLRPRISSLRRGRQSKRARLLLLLLARMEANGLKPNINIINAAILRLLAQMKARSLEPNAVHKRAAM